MFFATLIASWNFGTIGPYLEVIGMARGAAFKVFQVLESHPEMHKHHDVGKRPDFMSKIAFKNVRFSYPSRANVQVSSKLLKVWNGGATTLYISRTISLNFTTFWIYSEVFTGFKNMSVTKIITSIITNFVQLSNVLFFCHNCNAHFSQNLSWVGYLDYCYIRM